MNSTVETAVSDQVIALYKDQGKATATLKGRGRDTEEIDLVLRWDVTTCCWQCEGQTGEVRITEGTTGSIRRTTSPGKVYRPGSS